jgi:hypothetical protein
MDSATKYLLCKGFHHRPPLLFKGFVDRRSHGEGGEPCE